MSKKEKIIVTFTKTEDGLDVTVKMDPPLKNLDEPTPTQAIVLNMLADLKGDLEDV